MADLEVIDTHTHIARSKAHGREYGRYQLARFRGGVGPLDYPYPLSQVEPPVYGTVDEFQQLMAETGVAHMNFLMFTWAGLYYHDGRYTLPDEPSRRAKADEELKTRITERLRDNNEWAVNTVKEHKNLSFFCGIDPVVMDEKTLVAEVADKTTRGALGVKMVPDDSGVPGNDRRLWPVYEYCQSKDIPILSMTSSRPGAPSRPANFTEALGDFPRLKLICGHAGGGGEGEAEVVELTRKYENVAAEFTSFMRVTDDQMEEMAQRIRRIGIDRAMFGTNFLYSELIPLDEPVEGEKPKPLQFTETKKALEVLKKLPLKDAEREQIASKNFRRLTGLKA